MTKIDLSHEFGLFIDIITAWYRSLRINFITLPIHPETETPMSAEQWEPIDPLREDELTSDELRELQEVNGKLMLEREELEKNLVKEQFFKKLLEKELNQLKTQELTGETKKVKLSAYQYGPKKRISRKFILIILLLFAVGGGYAAFTLYSNYLQKRYLSKVSGPSSGVVAATTTELQNQRFSGKLLKDTSSEIINSTDEKAKTDTILFKSGQEAASTAQTVINDETDRSAGTYNPDKTISDPVVIKPSYPSKAENSNGGSPSTQVQNQTKPVQSQPVQENLIPSTPPVVVAETAPAPVKTEEPAAKPVPQPDAPVFPDAAKDDTPLESRKPVGFYKVVSKANIYTDPNENSLSGFFIYQFNPATFEALADKNGFIFVVATNNLGTVSKGWLSKKDLRRIDK